MLESKYRGLRKDGEGWVYGMPFKTIPEEESVYIMPLDSPYNGYEFQNDKGQWSLRFDNYYEVIPETVGQYTGIKDGQDTEIYLADRVKIGNTVYTVVWHKNGFKLLNDGEHSDFPYNLYMEVVA